MARAHVRPRKASRRTTSPSLSCSGSPRRHTRDTCRSRDRRPRGRPDVATSTARREAASAVPLTPAHPDDGVSTNRRLCTDTRKPTGKRHHSSSWRGSRTEPAVAASGRPSPRHLQVHSGYAARCHRQMRADDGLQPAVGRPPLGKHTLQGGCATARVQAAPRRLVPKLPFPVAADGRPLWVTRPRDEPSLSHIESLKVLYLLRTGLSALFYFMSATGLCQWNAGLLRVPANVTQVFPTVACHAGVLPPRQPMPQTWGEPMRHAPCSIPSCVVVRVAACCGTWHRSVFITIPCGRDWAATPQLPHLREALVGNRQPWTT